jgi:hypothetical protein
MRRFLVCACAMLAGAASAVTEAEFANPPKKDHPETWFHFIGGNVAEKGITADLEAIQGAGISGVQFFHGQFGGAWPGVEPQIKCLSAPWDGLVGRMAADAKRLGLRFTMQNCPGWAMSGGPWIAPSNAMRNLVWQRVDVQAVAPKRMAIPLPQMPSEDWKDYRDIGVIAFPTPEGDTGAALVPAAVKSNRANLDWSAWLKGKAVQLPVSANDPTVIEFTFNEPVTVRTVEMPCVDRMDHGRCYTPDTHVTVEAVAAEGATAVVDCELPQADWQDDQPLSLACDEATAKTFRVTLRNKHGISLEPIRLFSAARKNSWESEANWTLRSLMRLPEPRQTRRAWVASASVTNLAPFVSADKKTIAWDVPEGRWTLLRIGHVNAGRRNGPAPKEATGWECDKLSARGADTHFAGYIGRLSGEKGAVRGKLDAMLMDSWECARQTWTDGLEKTFEERRGYALGRWMPALFGWVVDDPETTARFLCDWRSLLSKLVTDEFFGRMAGHAHDNGLECQFETAFGDTLCGDILEYYKYADTPMCEFWSPHNGYFCGDINYKPIKPTVSAARMYGKKRVAAESLTSGALTWDEHFRDLKFDANLHLAEGVTHVIFHTYTHNPRTDWLPPGTSFGAGIGTPFLRGQTWWKHMPAFTAYFARCQEMLEDGRPVSDVLWYLGDEVDHKPLETAPFPDGYRFDYCNPDALLTRITVADGLWKTPDGISYRVLWMPNCVRMRPETIERIAELAAKGGLVAAPALPQDLATMSGGEKARRRFDAAVAKLRGCRTAFIGKPLEATLLSNGISPDVTADGLVWQHRQKDGSDWYFIVPKTRRGFNGTVGFRDCGQNRRVEIWQPSTGTAEAAGATEYLDGRTWLKLALPPSGSCFVVFRGKADVTGIARVERDGKARNDVLDFARTACVSARYGDLEHAGRWADITAQVQQLLKNDAATTIPANNDLAGADPAYQTVKQLTATFRLPDGTEQTLTAREGGDIQIPGMGQTGSPMPAYEIHGATVTAWTNGAYRIVRTDGTSVERATTTAACQMLNGGWDVRFPGGWGMPPLVKMAALIPWKDVDTTPEGKAFSGSATYTTTFTLPAQGKGSHVVLDLGHVESIAVVTLNGHRLGTVWCEPYRVDATAAAKAGVNELTIEVTNTWFNRLVYDAGQPDANRKTWTISGPSKDFALRPSGLLGPVCVYQGAELE